MRALGRRKLVVIVAAGLVVICIACLAIGSLSGGDRTPTPAAAATGERAEATQAPSATRPPTATPEPSGTPATIRARDELDELLPGGLVNVWDDYEARSAVVAKCEDGEPVTMLERSGDAVLIETVDGTRGWVTYSFIAVLSAAPTPEPTAIAGPPPSVQSYAVEIASISSSMGEAMVNVGLLAADYRPWDQEWVTDIAVQMALVKFLHQQLMDMEVPEDMEEIHAAILDATGDIDLAMDYLASGIDNMSAADIERATELMNSGRLKMDGIPGMVEEYMAQFE